MMLAVVNVSVVLLIALFISRSYVEPWVSCKHISDIFNTIDKSDTVVLASKFYVRGVRFYTDRKMGVIDILGKGFYSPHPIPYFNNDGDILMLLHEQPFTYCIVKDGSVIHLERIAGMGHYRLEHLYNIGGKYIYRIHKPKT